MGPFIKTPNYINFKYYEPIDEIKITGIFKPEEWSCHSTFSGEEVLSNKLKKKIIFDKVSQIIRQKNVKNRTKITKIFQRT